ncbi:hypothetical protein DMB44_03010 [Thermoplasma sp. Kam2015]|uniref:ATP-binding protein n=1 Tax=Thermoplasma sp. Kam2015 TaxID=2094122 RepID=UPI000D8EAC5D|nr:ATP-binding protein [Thermoplasma sp. Kam2015]PYB68591.1 hypothetical protein DMB44_03010 [Thermoplasma sp. Kam2015]
MNEEEERVLRNVLAYRPQYYGFRISTILMLMISSSLLLILIKIFNVYAFIIIPPLIIMLHSRSRKGMIRLIQRIKRDRPLDSVIIRSEGLTMIKVQNSTAVLAKMKTDYDNHAGTFGEISEFISDLMKTGLNITAYSIPHRPEEKRSEDPVIKGKVYYSTYLFLWNATNDIKNLKQSVKQIPGEGKKVHLYFNIEDSDIDNIHRIFHRSVLSPRKNYLSGEMNRSIFSLIDAEKPAFPTYCEAIEMSDIHAVVKFSMKQMNRERLLRIASSRIADINFELKQRKNRNENTEYLNSVMKSAEKLSNEYRKDEAQILLCGLDFMVIHNTPYGLTHEISKLDRGLKIAGMRAKNMSEAGTKSIFRFEDFRRENIAYPMDRISISSFFPAYFSSEELSGIFLGMNEYTGKPIFLDYFEHPSYNFVITGETGSGKSHFAGLLIKRISGSEYSRVLVLDPLSEYHCQDYSGPCIEMTLEEYIEELNTSREKIESARVIIVKYNLIKFEIDDNAGLDLARSISEYMSMVEGRKTVIIEEANIMLRNDQTLKIIENTVRHSRHFETAVVIITQSIEDIRLGATIEENSIHKFFFRNSRNTEGIEKYIPEEEDMTRLAGGKNRKFSECFYLYEDKYTKLLIAASD